MDQSPRRRSAAAPETSTAVPSSHTGRWLIAAAAVMWSSSGFFAKLPTFNEWPEADRGLLLAFWRALFAGLLIFPAVRRPRWQWQLLPMAGAFAMMNATYLTAMSLTTAANAIWLQSTAPWWVFVFGVFLLREPVNRRDLLPLVCGMLGVALILSHELHGEARWGIGCGLASAVGYAVVVLFMRGLRGEDTAWLVAVNHLITAAVIAPFVVYRGIWPTPLQLATLAAFGLFQMALPYVLFGRGLRTITGQEATAIGLLEPVLLPFWAYLARGEVPAWWTIAGAALILSGLTLRYTLLARQARAEPAPPA
jgi:DME family drug/metabolite transporter